MRGHGILGILIMLVTLCAASPGHAQKTTEDLKTSKRPVMGGHRFIANRLTGEAFPRTFVETRLGIGQALNVEFLPTYVLSNGDTLHGLDGDLMVAILDVDYQYAVKDWMAVWGSMGLVGRLGTDVGALLAEGATILTGFELGWLLRLVERQKWYLSGAVSVHSNGFTGVNLTDWVEGILAGDDTPLVRQIPSVRAQTGLRFAWAINDLFGFQASSALGFGEATTSRQGDSTTFGIAAVGDMDLFARTSVPLGIALGGEFTNTPRDGSDKYDQIVQGLLRFAYTGRDDFLLSIDFESAYLTGPDVKSITSGTILASMRYYFWKVTRAANDTTLKESLPCRGFRRHCHRRKWTMDLNGKRILITGGSLGIGRVTADVLVQSGAKVGITGRDAKRLQAAAAATGAHPIVADVAQAADIDRTYDEFLEYAGGLDCLINNAGIGVHKSLVDLSAEEIEAVWRVNVLGAALMAQRAARIFIKQKRGDIVNIASTSGLRGYETGSAYVASKFALRGMSECWRAELRRHNVRVILVNPSEVPTAFGNAERRERPEQDNKLTSMEIAHAIKATLEMDDRGFIPELSVFATNPF